jgi:hypothetical protein
MSPFDGFDVVFRAEGIRLVLRAQSTWTHGDVGDPYTLAVSVGVIFLAAIFASAGPALTAISIQPMQALRKE